MSSMIVSTATCLLTYHNSRQDKIVHSVLELVMSIETMSGTSAVSVEVISEVPYLLGELRFLRYTKPYLLLSQRYNQIHLALFAMVLAISTKRNIKIGEYASIAQKNTTPQ